MARGRTWDSIWKCEELRRIDEWQGRCWVRFSLSQFSHFCCLQTCATHDRIGLRRQRGQFGGEDTVRHIPLERLLPNDYRSRSTPTVCIYPLPRRFAGVCPTCEWQL